MRVGLSDTSWGQLAWGRGMCVWSLICPYWPHTLYFILG